MRITGADDTKATKNSWPVGLILAIVFAVVYFLLGAGQAHAQDVQPAGAGDFPAVTLEGLETAGAFGSAITILPNGNFVVVDPLHDVSNITDAGSVTLFDGDTLRVLSSTFGGQINSKVGAGGIIVLGDGNFVIASPNYGVEGADSVGAVTWCDAEAGCPRHVLPENSLIGSTEDDQVGTRVVAIGEGGYIVLSPHWHHAGVVDAGAVTRCNPVSDCTGVVVESGNSVVGSSIGDRIGEETLTILANGDYVIAAPVWDFGALTDLGAVRRCPVSGDACMSQMLESNALIGTASFDSIGYGGVRAAGDGYVVASPYYNLGAFADVGAVTFCADECTGELTGGNSLVGSHANDNLGIGGTIVVDGGSAYVIASPLWDAGAVSDVGAVTYCRVEAPCAGLDVDGRSLYGTQAGDKVGEAGVTALASGDYVVASSSWANVASQVGAVTLCGGATGCQDVAVSTANSVYGATLNDRIGSLGVKALEGGGYVVSSPNWDNAGMVDAGAVTWCSALGCAASPVSQANSLVGTNTLDGVWATTVLDNGNYVVNAPFFNIGAVTDGGKVVLCNGETGCLGAMGTIAGIEGNVVGQNVGSEVLALTNGNFVVRTANYDSGANTNVGAVTWCSGTTGCPANVSNANSVFGARTGDELASEGMFAQGNGDALLISDMADSATHTDAGAITWVRGDAATNGAMNTLPTIYGGINGAGATLVPAFNNAHIYLIGGLPTQNQVVVLMARPSIFVNLNGDGHGTVASSTGGIDCGDDCLEGASIGTTITLTAAPATNSNFAGWSGACSGTGICEVTVQGATQVTATFATKMFAVMLPDTFEGGDVTVSVEATPAEAASSEESIDPTAIVPASTSGAVVYAYGTVLKLTAVPDPDYVFQEWTGDKSGEQNPIQFSVTKELTIGAIFRSVDAPDPDLDIYLPVINR